MKTNFIGGIFYLLCLGGGLVACVDDTYDLNDVDLTVTVGGDLAIPGLNTEEITLEKILKLENNSSVQADAEGNYTLTQQGKASKTEVTIDPVTIKRSDMDISSTMDHIISFRFDPAWLNLPQFQNVVLNREVTMKDSITVDKQDLTKDLLDIKSAKVDNMPVRFHLRFLGFASVVYLQAGFSMNMPSYVMIKSDDPRVRTERNRMIFTEDVAMESGKDVIVDGWVTSIDFEALKERGMGIVEPGHLYVEDEFYSTGTAYLKVSDITVEQASLVNITLQSQVEQGNMYLTEVVAKVDPDIDIHVDPINVVNIPDFLNDDDAIIDLKDPRMFLTVSNPTPVDINLTAELVSVKDNQELDGSRVHIGSETETDQQIIIPANTENYRICIHRLSDDVGIDADRIVTVPELNNIIEKIPDVIKIEPEAKAVQNYYTIPLGSSYQVTGDYQFEAPLQFNERTEIIYSEEMSGWASDMKQVDANEAVITVKLTNTIPLNMVLSADVIDESGNVLSGVTVSTDGEILSGTPDSPQVSDLQIIVKPDAVGILHRMDGIRYRVVARADEKTDDVLNENQSLKLDDVRIVLKGGITLDLN